VSDNWNNETRKTALEAAAAGPILRAVWSGGSAALGLQFGTAYAVGRGDECHLRIDSDTVSRRHAEVRLTAAGDLEVTDLGSANGTKLSGQLLAAHTPGRVAAGDLIELGGVLLTLQAAPSSTTDLEIETPMRRLLRNVDLVAKSPLSVMILGESGVGKEVLAARIHSGSTRAHASFVKVNCAALVDNLLEAELFGYERGAFTGAVQSKAGLLESADGGTFLLDEVGEMPLATQAKLLRVIETGELNRVGGLRPKKIDVRFISATNRVLADEVRAGRFREDLYFRLDGFSVTVPPLRERRDEIAGLAEQFLEEICRQLERATVRLAADAVEKLQGQRWPGNIRELRNVLSRSVVLCGDTRLTANDLQFGSAQGQSGQGARDSGEGVVDAQGERGADDQRERIVAALAHAGGNQKRAALELGISVRTLQYRMDALAIQRPRK
jgi:two-component system, NtrC family, response regulator AtoC